MTLIRLILPALLSLALMAGPVRAQTPPETAEASQPLFVIVYRAGPAWRPGAPMAEQPGMREHFFYIRDAHAAGVILTAGPWGDDGGVIVLRAESLEAARAVMAADPAVAGGLFEGEVRGFDPRFTTDEAIR